MDMMLRLGISEYMHAVCRLGRLALQGTVSR